MLKKSVASTTRVVLYARVATKTQATDDRCTLDAQLTELRDYAARQGWLNAGEFSETISGLRRDRPQLEAVLGLVQERAFDILLVHELSRLSRSIAHTLDILDILENHQVGFASVKEPDFDFTKWRKAVPLII